FPYPGYEKIDPADVPDQNLMGIYAPQTPEGVDEAKVLREGFANPIAAPRLRDAVRGKTSVLLLIDDATRETPADRILPLLLEELHAGGIRDDRIELLQAAG